MKQFSIYSKLIILLIISIVAISCIDTRTAAAASVSATQELHVTAKVIPMRHIIIDQTGRITQITSNTAEDIAPQVFLLSDRPDNSLPVTPAIMTEYRKYLPPGSATTGILTLQHIPTADSVAANAFRPAWNR